MTISPLDYPILDGRPVTEAHARYCRDHGHAVHTVDGARYAHCPRCGKYTAPEAATDLADTRYADAAYARQVADEASAGAAPEAATDLAAYRRVLASYGAPCDTVAPAAACASCGTAEDSPCPAWCPSNGAESTASTHDAAFRAAHDAYMREAYREPWDVQPRECPSSGDPLTGTYGRTYAEDGWLLMQAAGDMFGPATGSTPVLLFSVATHAGEPLRHAPMGGARLTHVDTYDTWHAALSALRWHIDHAG